MTSSFFFVFLLSSRRRHTRCYRDWSSDVCSSGLQPRRDPPAVRPRGCDDGPWPERHAEIGRAAWRGRGEISVGAGSLKKKKKTQTKRRPIPCSASLTSTCFEPPTPS